MKLPDREPLQIVHHDVYLGDEQHSVRRSKMESGKNYIGRLVLPSMRTDFENYAADFYFRVDDVNPPRKERAIQYPLRDMIQPVGLSLLDDEQQFVETVEDAFVDLAGVLTSSRLWSPLPVRSHKELGYLLEIPKSGAELHQQTQGLVQQTAVNLPVPIHSGF